MSLATKALFVIDRNLDREITLESVAAACHVSRFHLAHAFAAFTGWSVMEYTRARRLSEAARALAQGSPNILDVAVAAGYASHEAFSRAFHARFDITPEELRRRGALGGLNLVEGLIMKTPKPDSLAPPDIRRMGEALFVGLAAQRRLGDAAKIPAQWRDFMSGPYHGIEHKCDGAPVGLTLPGDSEEEFLYVCAAQVTRLGSMSKDLIALTVEPAEYAVFAHDGHVSELPQTYAAIWSEWFPSSARKPKNAATIERHNAAFDPRTGEGGVNIWIPLV